MFTQRATRLLHLLAITNCLAIVVAVGHAQVSTASIPDWQKTAGGKLAFEVASVRQNKSDDKPAGNFFSPTGGLYSGQNIVLVSYIAFAYKLSNKQLQSVVAQAPWTATTMFDIEARPEGNPTKDQYRLMMQSLLEDRFKLKIHFETRQVPVYGLVQVKPGKLGPQIQVHKADDPICAKPLAEAPQGGFPAAADGFPEFCSGLVRMKPSGPSRVKAGGRDYPMAQFATTLAPGLGALVDRPVLDQTGLGNVDFVLEWAMAAAQVSPGEEFQTDESVPPFEEAIKEQLGLKLVPQKKGPVEFFVIDHIEMPSEN